MKKKKIAFASFQNIFNEERLISDKIPSGPTEKAAGIVEQRNFRFRDTFVFFIKKQRSIQRLLLCFHF